MRTNRLEQLFDPHRRREPKGDNDRYVRKENVARILADLLRSATYQAGNGEGDGSSGEIASFRKNAEYWEQARRQPFFHGQRVSLDRFWITEWAPLSPGQYFTDKAESNRKLASNFVNEKRDDYLPLGKNYMMLGGIGSLRFAPKRVGNDDIFVLGASSSGVSHEGIPVTCEGDIYRHVAQNIKQTGGVQCNVHGYMRHLPNEISKLRFSQNVEKYCMHITDIDAQAVATQSDLLCTAQILFPSGYPTYREDDSDEYFEGDGYETRLVKSWSFASFRPGHDIGKDMISLSQAATWLEEYVGRYGDKNVPILNDFDEMQNHFTTPIEFPLTAVKAGNINSARLESYQEYLGSSDRSSRRTKPAAKPKWYVSYAWGDDRTAQGRTSEDVVDELCAAAAARGRKILRDKDVLGLGQSISAFMRDIGAGDRIFVILSDKYLRSRYCMFELSEIWRTSKQEGDAFLSRVRVYALPGTKVSRPEDWADWAIYWRQEHDALDKRAREYGATILGEHGHRKLMEMQRFYTQVPDILGTLADIVQPRSLKELERYGLEDPATR
jgi:internalin A